MWLLPSTWLLRTMQRCPPSPLLFNIVLEILATAIRQKVEIKSIQIEKEEVNLSFLKLLIPYPKYMILYLEDLKVSSKRLFKLVNAAKYQVIKSTLKIKNFYTSVMEIRKTIPSQSLQKYLGINLTRMKEFYDETFRTLKKEI